MFGRAVRSNTRPVDTGTRAGSRTPHRRAPAQAIPAPHPRPRSYGSQYAALVHTTPNQQPRRTDTSSLPRRSSGPAVLSLDDGQRRGNLSEMRRPCPVPGTNRQTNTPGSIWGVRRRRAGSPNKGRRPTALRRGKITRTLTWLMTVTTPSESCTYDLITFTSRAGEERRTTSPTANRSAVPSIRASKHGLVLIQEHRPDLGHRRIMSEGMPFRPDMFPSIDAVGGTSNHCHPRGTRTSPS